MKLTERAVKGKFCMQAVYRITFHLHYNSTFYRPYDKKTYLAVGSMKTLLLNVSLLNAGDDAYETVLHIQIPKGLYFIRILELVRTKEFVKQESFEIFLFQPDIFQIMLMDC